MKSIYSQKVVPVSEANRLRELVGLTGYGIQSYVANKLGVSRQLVFYTLSTWNKCKSRSDIGYKIIEALREAVKEEPFRSSIEQTARIKAALEGGRTVKLERMKYAEAQSIQKRLQRLGVKFSVEVEDDWPKSYRLRNR